MLVAVLPIRATFINLGLELSWLAIAPPSFALLFLNIILRSVGDD